MATKDEGRLIYTTDDMSINLYQVRVPLIAQSWDPGSEEVETQGGNGRKWEEMGEREREGERGREGEREKCCFCLQNDLKEP